MFRNLSKLLTVMCVRTSWLNNSLSSSYNNYIWKSQTQVQKRLAFLCSVSSTTFLLCFQSSTKKKKRERERERQTERVNIREVAQNAGSR